MLSPKRQLTFNRLYCIISLKIEFFTLYFECSSSVSYNSKIIKQTRVNIPKFFRYVCISDFFYFIFSLALYSFLPMIKEMVMPNWIKN
jgi:hypothetical protein